MIVDLSLVEREQNWFNVIVGYRNTKPILHFLYSHGYLSSFDILEPKVEFYIPALPRPRRAPPFQFDELHAKVFFFNPHQFFTPSYHPQ